MDEKRDAAHGIGRQAPLNMEKQVAEDKKARERDAAVDRRPDLAHLALMRGQMVNELAAALRVYRMAHSVEFEALGPEGEADLIHDALRSMVQLQPTAEGVKERLRAEQRHEDAVAKAEKQKNP